MQRIVIIALAALCAACGQRPDKGRTEAPAAGITESVATAESASAAEPAIAADTSRRDGVEVLSFHAKRRCATCVAIERLTREVVAAHFPQQVADGTLRLRVIDITEEEAIAERYEISWSSLLLCRHEGRSEEVNDLTRMAFAKARTAPEEFKSELKAEIEKMLADNTPEK